METPLNAIVGMRRSPLESVRAIQAGYRAGQSGAPEALAEHTVEPMRAQPALFVDVDGVISLFGFTREAMPAGRFETVDGIAHFLSASAGEHLRQLAEHFEPVWCTGWEEKANEYLPHALGLPGPYPYLTFERDVGGGPISRAHWKLGAIEAYAGARPLAWIDDAHDGDCAAWAAARTAPTLLVTTAPAIGLTDADVERLLGWATRVAQP